MSPAPESRAPVAAEHGEAPVLYLQKGDWRFGLQGALGGRWWARVGDDGDVTRFDVAATEGVAVTPLALEGSVDGPGGLFASLRLEEGQVHAGAVEAAEARVGVAERRGLASAWVGRADLPVTRDRARETEDLSFSTRPLLSRVALPLHAGGLGGALAWPERAELQAGLSYATTSSDAPLLWARLDLHPFGALPEDQQATVSGLRLSAAGGVAWLDSPTLGVQAIYAADAELGWGPARLEGGWTGWRIEEIEGDVRLRQEASLELGARVLRLHGLGIRLAARGERIAGLLEGEDARWLAWGRAALQGWQDRAELYVELVLSREQGPGVAIEDDVVVLVAGAERANDVAGAGFRVRY